MGLGGPLVVEGELSAVSGRRGRRLRHGDGIMNVDRPPSLSFEFRGRLYGGIHTNDESRVIILKVCDNNATVQENNGSEKERSIDSVSVVFIVLHRF